MTWAATIPRIFLKETGKNRPWNCRLIVLKTIKMTLIRPPHDQFQDDSRNWPCCSTCSPLPPAIHPWNSPLKALAHWLSLGESAFGHESTHPQLPASKIKQTFHQLCLFIGFRAVSCRTPLSVTICYCSLKKWIHVLHLTAEREVRLEMLG